MPYDLSTHISELVRVNYPWDRVISLAAAAVVCCQDDFKPYMIIRKKHICIGVWLFSYIFKLRYQSNCLFICKQLHELEQIAPSPLCEELWCMPEWHFSLHFSWPQCVQSRMSLLKSFMCQLGLWDYFFNFHMKFMSSHYCG